MLIGLCRSLWRRTNAWNVSSGNPFCCNTTHRRSANALYLCWFAFCFDDGELCHETVIHSFCPKLNFKCEQLEQRWLKKKKDEKDYTEQDLMHQNTPTFLKLVTGAGLIKSDKSSMDWWHHENRNDDELEESKLYVESLYTKKNS